MLVWLLLSPSAGAQFSQLDDHGTSHFSVRAEEALPLRGACRRELAAASTD